MEKEENKVSLRLLLFSEVLIQLSCNQEMSEDIALAVPGGLAQPRHEEIGASRTSWGGDLVIR